MNILIDTVRIYGFRGLRNIEVSLEPFTVLTGMNNTGKTSFHKALQVVLGNRLFISPDDFYISETEKVNEIIVDIRIVPIDNDAKKANNFTDEWLEIFTDDRIIVNAEGEQFIPLRTVVTIDSITNTFKTKQYIQQEWVVFKNEDDKHWYQSENGTEKPFHFDETPFFYMDAQRDIIEDIKVRNSYLGKMLSKIEYSKKDIIAIEKQIKELNEHAVESSDVLSNIETTLKELDTAMDNTNNGVDITPFPKKVRDLNKGVSIQYSDFSMEYHGMGTRSWSSLLTLKSFISLFAKTSENNDKPFFPIIAIEEPEAHLHPNAQKKLFGQIAGIQGQKIISTHSSYVAGSAELEQIRSFYKGHDDVVCGKIDTSGFSSEDIRKIKRQVINTRGELFFSKVIIFCEGETEEQAMPIFAEKYFGKSTIEIGIDFVGVGGQGNYLPFLRVAESLNIPWFIFSDAENTSGKNIKVSVQNQFLKCGTTKTESDSIVFLNDGNDYEKQLINDGFGREIKKAIASLDIYKNKKHREAKGAKRLKEIESYDNEKLYEIFTGSKTQFGPAVAYAIIESNKDLPQKIIDLFDKIKESLNIKR
ncbi:hypothetical protein BMS3Abin03_00025 [bacterium BMS3Abin03]|nr:hypothetical protein BMS3Abin03_00025 [bacterium BMS3Abin03]